MSSAREHLEAAFGQAAPEHLDWQTASPYVAERERELVRAAFLPLGERVLDLGCAEGATLLHLDVGARNGAPGSGAGPSSCTGVDLFEPKLALARERLPGCRFIAGSADALPFAAASFDHVLIRDVIHHLEEPERAVDEVARVLAPGGRVDVLEPCRYNPLIALHALTQPAERGELRSTRAFLTQLLARRFRVVSVTRHQPLPIHRLVFHPRFGRAGAAQNPAVRALVRGFEQLAARAMPGFAWAYLHVRADLPG
jgi:ubiquinone/menaquinone biosynthesis C-methylase UbiE